MGNIRKGTKVYKELMAGLPEKIDLLIDWNETAMKCDVDRRNCAIHLALSGREDITQVSVGWDEINFIWRGDARVSVAPSAELIEVIIDNDRAARGDQPWRKGTSHVVLDLSGAALKKDLRVGRAVKRKQRQLNPEGQRNVLRASRERSKDLSVEARIAKKVNTERTRGRFV